MVAVAAAERDVPAEIPFDPKAARARFRRARGLRLRDARRNAGLSQAEAAETLGVSQRTVSRLELGDIEPVEGSKRSEGGFRRDSASFRRDSGGVESEVSYGALATLYRCVVGDLRPRNQYPSAPADPVDRRAWLEARNERVRRGVVAE